MKEKTFERWTRKDFEALPDISELNDKPEIVDSLVILPTRRMHDSGYRIMHFAAIVNNKPICRLAGCSDVIKIGGIAGYNGKSTLNQVVPIGWSIDCLATSGLLRLFCDTRIRLTPPFSTFEVYYLDREEVAK